MKIEFKEDWKGACLGACQPESGRAEVAESEVASCLGRDPDQLSPRFSPGYSGPLWCEFEVESRGVGDALAPEW